MHKLLERLQRDHKNLERLMELLETQLDAFSEGRESNFDLKSELLEYLETYAQLVHHPTEDLIFAAARPLLPEMQAIFDKLAGQHRDLVMLTRKFRNALEGIMQGAVQTREEVSIEGREYIALQRVHLHLEDTEVFPSIDQVLTAKEWKKIEKKLPEGDDPVFGKRDSRRFSVLYKYLKGAESGK